MYRQSRRSLFSFPPRSLCPAGPVPVRVRDADGVHAGHRLQVPGQLPGRQDQGARDQRQENQKECLPNGVHGEFENLAAEKKSKLAAAAAAAFLRHKIFKLLPTLHFLVFVPPCFRRLIFCPSSER